MKALVLIVLGVTTQSAFADSFTGNLVASCTSTSGEVKTYTAEAVQTRDGKTLFKKFSSRTNKYIVTASTTANCEISAERDGHRPY
jgi:hypothetical protein